jgi:hypothetical protein
MTSIYKSIEEWIRSILVELMSEFPHPYSILDLEHIPLPAEHNGYEFQAGGIFSSPNDITVELIGGQVKHEDFKTFYLRRPFVNPELRQENEAFLERLKEKIHERNLDYNMPKDGRDWKSIEINAGIYPALKAENNEYADYLIPLRLVYTS